MVTNIAIVATILNAKTSYVITSYPNYVESNGFNLLNPDQDFPREHNVTQEIYYLQILALTEDLLKTAITAFLQVDSRHGSGYRQSVIGYPLWIEVEQGYMDINNTFAYMRILCKWAV